MHISHVCCVLLFAASNPAAADDDWPEFRGPTGQGHAAAARTPLEWSTTRHVTWSQPVAGAGWSSPVVAGKAVFLTTAVAVPGAERSLRVLRIHRDSGALEWTTEVFRQDEGTAPAIHTKNSHASPTPIVDGKYVFVHFGHAGTACLDVDGSVIWRNPELAYRPVHGNGGSPALAGDVLVFSCDGAEDPFVVALDKHTGRIRWKTARETDAVKKFSFSTPLLIDVQGRPQLVSPGSNCVCALDPSSGKEIWRVTYDGYSVIPRPVFGNQLVYIATGYDQPKLLAIDPSGSGNVTETHVAWQIDSGVPRTPSLLLDGDRLYMISDRGVLSCADAHTGELRWRDRLQGDFSASPVMAGGHLYFQNETGTGYVIRAGDAFQLVAQNELGEPTLASYAVAGRSLFIRTQSRLYRIDE